MDVLSIEHQNPLEVGAHDCSLSSMGDGDDRCKSSLKEENDGATHLSSGVMEEDAGSVIKLSHHPDVWLHILSQVSLREIGGIPRVCRTFAEAPPFSDPWLPFWQSLLAERAPGAAHVRTTWHTARPGSRLAGWQAGVRARGLCGKVLCLAEEPWKTALKAVLALQFPLPPTSPAPPDWIRPGAFNAGLHELTLCLVSIAGLLLTMPGPAPGPAAHMRASIDREWGRVTGGSPELSSGDSFALADMIAWTYSVAHGLAVHQYANQHFLASMLVGVVKLHVVPGLLALLPDLFPDNCTCHAGRSGAGLGLPCTESARATLATVVSRVKAVGIAFSAALSYLDLFHAMRTRTSPVLVHFFNAVVCALRTGRGDQTPACCPALCCCASLEEDQGRGQQQPEGEDPSDPKHKPAEDGCSGQTAGAKGAVELKHGQEEDKMLDPSRGGVCLGALGSSPLEVRESSLGVERFSGKELLSRVAQRMDLAGQRSRVGVTTCYSTAWESTAFEVAFTRAAESVLLDLETAANNHADGLSCSPTADAEAAPTNSAPPQTAASANPHGSSPIVREIPPNSVEVRVWCPSEQSIKSASMPSVCVHDSAFLFRTAEAVAAASEAVRCQWPAEDVCTKGRQKAEDPSPVLSRATSFGSVSESQDERDFLPFLKLQVNFAPLAGSTCLEAFTSSLVSSLFSPNEAGLVLPDLPSSFSDMPNPLLPYDPPAAEASSSARSSLPPGLPPSPLLSRQASLNRNRSTITTPLLGPSRRNTGSSDDNLEWEEIMGIAHNFFGIERLIRRKTLLENTGSRRRERRRSGAFDTSMRVLFGIEADEGSEDEMPDLHILHLK